MMQSYFSWFNLPFSFLFEKWVIGAATSLGFTCLVVFSIAVLLEGLRVLSITVREFFYAIPLTPIPSDHGINSMESSMESLTSSIKVTDSLIYVKKQRIKNHCLQSIFHVIKVLGSYGLMLAVMTFNGYIAISLLLGATLGYFVFCHNLQNPEIEPCQNESITRTTTVASSCSNSTGPSLSHLVVEEL